MITKEELAKYVESGKHGVTKHQLIPAVVKNIKKKDVICALHKTYPNTFKSAFRYFKKKEKTEIVNILGVDPSKTSADELALIQELKPNRKGVSMHQIIDFVETNVAKSKFDKIALVQKFFPEYYKRAQRYMKRQTQDKIKAFSAAKKATNTVKAAKKA